MKAILGFIGRIFAGSTKPVGTCRCGGPLREEASWVGLYEFCEKCGAARDKD